VAVKNHVHVYNIVVQNISINPLNAELNPIRHLLALAGARHFVDVSRIRANLFKFIFFRVNKLRIIGEYIDMTVSCVW
jgi:uncharacterized membrane protein